MGVVDFRHVVNGILEYTNCSPGIIPNLFLDATYLLEDSQKLCNTPVLITPIWQVPRMNSEKLFKRVDIPSYYQRNFLL